MFERFKKIRELSKDFSTLFPHETDEDGRSVVRLEVSGGGFLSPFSAPGLPVASSDMADFLNHSLKHIKPENPLHLMISGGAIATEEQETYRAAIANYYHLEFLETRTRIRRNTAVSFIMTLVAAALFTASVLLSSRGFRTVALNMLDVMAWVFMWEAVEQFCMERPLLKLQLLRSLKIMRAKVSFIESSCGQSVPR
ncbi:MAG: hypothetical protein K2H09_05230 [Treponemataceae bacterium]|nr:hypothetical protein [Treponemataceae bacterium]